MFCVDPREQDTKQWRVGHNRWPGDQPGHCHEVQSDVDLNPPDGFRTSDDMPYNRSALESVSRDARGRADARSALRSLYLSSAGVGQQSGASIGTAFSHARTRGRGRSRYMQLRPTLTCAMQQALIDDTRARLLDAAF